MSKDDIVQKIKEDLLYLRLTYHIKKMGLFGSVVRGDDNDKSDVDILVEFEKPIGFFDFIRLEGRLSKILNKKVDLVSGKAIKPAIRNEILKNLIYV